MPPELVDLLIKNGLVMTLDGERRIIKNCDIAVKDERITAIGSGLAVEAHRIIDAGDHAVLPGFVDAHMHETLTRGLNEDLPLDRWLEEICFPLDRAHTPDSIRAAALMSQLEMIQGGITTFVDIYRYPDAAAQVAEVSGLRAIFTPQIITDPPGAGETIESNETFVAHWKDRNPRIQPAFGPHAPYSCPPEAYRQVAELAEKYDTRLHTHLAETQWEVGLLREKYNCSPAEYLEQAGFLSPRLSVAHGVQLTPPEFEILIAHGVSVVYNPISNMKLASGVAPIPDMMAAGLNVALGTDSNLSNNNLDIFEEMRIGAMLQKLHRQDAAVMSCQTMLDLATRNAARSLGLADEVGSIEIGKQADIILVGLNQPHLWPLVDTGSFMNLPEQLVYAGRASDVTHTIVAGKILMDNREVLTLDAAEARRAAQEETDAILKRAGLV
jgi:5-methylthioadenosine/S-adenosylhomocysteine deaminase